MLFVVGMTKPDFFLSAFETANFDPSVLPRSPAYHEPFVFIFAFGSPDLSPSIRQLAWTESMLLIFGISCLGLISLLPVADKVSLGPVLSVRSFGCLGPSFSLLSYSSLGPPSPLRQSARPGLAFLVPAISRLDFAMFVFDRFTVGFITLLQSLVCIGFSVSLLGFSTPGSLPSAKSFSCLDSTLPFLRTSDSELSLFLRSLSCLALAFFVFGSANAEPHLFVLDFSLVDFAVLLKSFG